MLLPQSHLGQDAKAEAALPGLRQLGADKADSRSREGCIWLVGVHLACNSAFAMQAEHWAAHLATPPGLSHGKAVCLLLMTLPHLCDRVCSGSLWPQSLRRQTDSLVRTEQHAPRSARLQAVSLAKLNLQHVQHRMVQAAASRQRCSLLDRIRLDMQYSRVCHLLAYKVPGQAGLSRPVNRSAQAT